MAKRVLVPLDRSPESEGVLPLVQDRLEPGGIVVLLHVIPADPERTAFGSKREEEMRDDAMTYLQGLVASLGVPSDRWRCDVIVHQSVVEGIADYAARGEADLIAMYTHDRKGLAKMVQGSITEKVSHEADIAVLVFTPGEVA